MTTKKNLTITLNNEDYNNLDELVNHFQKKSISTVTKTDVLKHLIRQMKENIKEK